MIDSPLTSLPPAGAKFSEDRKYRYLLWRRMDSALPMITFIGLNPSKANEDTNDNTITLLRVTLINFLVTVDFICAICLVLSLPIQTF